MIHYQLVDIRNIITSIQSDFIDGVRTRQDTSAIRNGHWNRLTGKFDDNYPIIVTDMFVGIDNISGDKAAKVNRKNPGTLVYNYGKKHPALHQYSKKNG